MRKFEYAKDNPYGDFGLPRRSTKNAAGYDFIAPYDFTVKPNETVLVKTFVKCKMPPDFYMTASGMCTSFQSVYCPKGNREGSVWSM